MQQLRQAFVTPASCPSRKRSFTVRAWPHAEVHGNGTAYVQTGRAMVIELCDLAGNLAGTA